MREKQLKKKKKDELVAIVIRLEQEVQSLREAREASTAVYGPIPKTAFW